MDNIRNDVVYLDLVRHIKQYLKEFKCSFFDQETEEIKEIIEKDQRDEEVTLEELVLLAEHELANNYIKAFRDKVLDHDLIILPDDKSDFICELLNG